MQEMTFIYTSINDAYCTAVVSFIVNLQGSNVGEMCSWKAAASVEACFTLQPVQLLALQWGPCRSEMESGIWFILMVVWTIWKCIVFEPEWRA
jgi:hypothetical protein